MNDLVAQLLSPTPVEPDPEDQTPFDDGTRARTSKGFSAGDDSGVIPVRRLIDDEDDEEDAKYVKSSRAELFGKRRRGSGESDELDLVDDDDDDDDEEEEEDEDDEEDDDDEEEDDDDESEEEDSPLQKSVFEAVGDAQLDDLLEKFDDDDAERAAGAAAEAPARLRSCAVARRHDALEGDVMEFRVLLQSAAAAAAKLPSGRGDDAAAAACAGLVDAFLDLGAAASGAPKRPRDGDDVDALWAAVDGAVAEKRPRWAAAADCWRRRTHLGAAQAKHGLKATNLGPFDQAAHALRDAARARRKMHPRRAGAADADGDDGLDLELYCDAALYKAQLRDFLDRRPQAAAGARGVYDDAAAQLGAARGAARAPKKGGKAERTTKGRSLRFEAHEKLMNFMFPVPGPTPGVDVDMLLQSLFK